MAFSLLKLGLDDIQAKIHLFVDFGADIHAKGEHGNVLEYVWKAMHCESSFDCLEVRAYGIPIDILINMGVTNAVCDPNGMVPSKKRMLAMSKKEHPSPRDMSLYYYGTIARSDEWTFRRGCSVRVSSLDTSQIKTPSDE